MLSPSYAVYKRDTSRVVQWLIKTSNDIITSKGKKTFPDGVPLTPNLTGALTVARIAPISKLIAQHNKRPPTGILRKFRSIIEARTAAYENFRAFAVAQPSPKIERSNRSHKHFINVLSQAFDTLGGTEGLKRGD